MDEYEQGFEAGHIKGLNDRDAGRKHKIKARAPKGGDEQLWLQGYRDGYNEAYPKT